MQGDADDAGDAEFPYESSARDAKARSEAVKAREDIAARLEVDAALRGQGEVFSVVDERDAEAFLDCTYLLAHRALGDAACLSGA